MQHRKEIDGLRALAVLPVMCFHAGFGIFPGGFLGVDIFFVISGYLITRLIEQELVSGTFSLRRFYARRARRILPALFAVIICSIPFAWVWMLPTQYAEFSRSILSVLLFISNIFFWRESGYFSAAAEEKPLLHTWSLSVEEQFYIFFPLLLLLLWRFVQNRRMLLIIVLAIISLLLCEYASYRYPSANFFLLPTRIWELAAGAIGALLHRYPPRPKQGAALLGLVMVVVPLFAYDATMRLPSFYTLVPVLGTLLLLRYAVGGTWVARMLSLPPLVGVGLISYSAYLWHQPLLAIPRSVSPNALSDTAVFGLMVLALMLAALSWRYIEQPFRDRSSSYFVGNKAALCMALAAVLLLLAVGMHGHQTQGRLAYWMQHTRPESVQAFQLIQQAKRGEDEQFFDNGDCVLRVDVLTPALQERLEACQRKYGSGVALIGDSHGVNQFYVWKERAGNFPFLLGLSRGSCWPYGAQPLCYYEALQALVKEQPAMFSHIVFEQAGSYLLQDAKGNPIDRFAFLDLPLDATVPPFAPNSTYIDTIARYLEGLAQYSKVIWFGPRMEHNIREQALVRLGCDHTFRLRPNQEAVFRGLEAAIRERLKSSSVRYVSQIDLLAFNPERDLLNCKVSYWSDGNHYSSVGESYFGQRLSLQDILQNEAVKP